MPYGTVNADVVQSSVSGVSLGAGNASIMKNRIINGAMVIDQRNAGASVTPASASYTLDRWQALASQASKFSVQQNAGSIAAPVGFNNYLGVLSSSAYVLGAGDFFTIGQPIEGYNTADLNWGTANAKTVTLSFWVWSSLTGTFGGVIQNQVTAGGRYYPFTYSIPVGSTWTQISVTIAGDTSGTWNTTNGTGIYVNFGLGVGSTYNSTAGSWTGTYTLGATGATSIVSSNAARFNITGVQLEVGSSVTGFEYRQYQQELALCQRYYETQAIASSAVGLVGQANGTTTGFYPAFYVVTKRVAPTFTATGPLITLTALGSNAGGTLSLTYASTNSARLDVTGASGLVAGNAISLFGNGNGALNFSSEL
jgi:hypothetical protein